MKRSYWLFLFTFALVFYALGASYIESFVNYRTWHLIGAEEFKAYHHELRPRIIALMVVPIFSLPIFNLILLFYRPPAIPLWGIVTSLVLTLTIIIVSVTVQIPIQVQLSDGGLSIPLIDKLILTDWIRKVPATANAVLYLWMMSVLLRRGADSDTQLK